MKRRRWLAMAMAVVMTASSIPAGTFTAFAAEEEVWVDSADIDQQEEAIVEDNILAEEASYGGDLLFAEDLLLEDETDSDFFEEGILQDDSAVFEDGFSEDNFDEEDIEPEFDMEITDDVLEDGFLPEAEDAEETIDELDGMVEEETAPEEEEASVEDDIIAEPEEDIGDLEEAAAVDRMALDFSAAQVLQIGVPVAVEISEPGERILFSFTPEEDGTYVFRSSDIESGDPMGYLYDGDGNELIEVDDYGLQGMNFWIIYDLEEGETYYLEASENGEDDPASYMVSVIKRDLTLPESSYSFSVSPGETLTLTAVATASTNLTYRWYRDSYYFETFSTEAEITITPEKSSYWFCEVSDETGDSLTISYDVKIDNAFDARAAGADEDNPHFLSQTVAPGTEVILQVEAEAANGGFTYQWYDNWNLMDGEENASLTVTADVNGYYICRVEDAYGNIREVYFDIYIENEFDAWAVGADEEDPYNLSQTVTPGTEVTLQVEAETTSGDITYQWYDDNWNTMEGEETAYLTVIADKNDRYICRAYDMYGNSREVCFYIYIENEFDAWAVGADEENPYNLSQTVAPGTEVTLQVEAETASGGITYQWYDDNWNMMEGEETAYLTVIADKNDRYICRAYDMYGNSRDVYFYIYIENEFDAWAVGADEEDPYNLSQTVTPGTEVTLQVEAETTSGDITYQWYDDNWNTMEGEETAYLTVIADKNDRYICRAYDMYGNSRDVYFYIYIENEFDAWAVGADEEDPYNLSQTVTPGTEVTLQVEAETTSGDITYQWYDDDGRMMEGEETAYLTVIADKNDCYICCAYDMYGNSRDVYFYIYIENEFDAWAVGADEEDPYNLSQTVTPGTEVTLQVEAETASGDITYQWYDDDENMMEGEESASLTVVADKSSYYRCYVYDAYGNSREIEFYIQIDNAFDVRAVGANTYDPLNLYKTVAPEEEITLEVEASAAEGEIAYQWLDDDENEIEGETNASYTVTAEVSTRYICQVSDDYGNYQNVYFYITVDNAFSAHAKDYITDYYVKRGSDLDLWVEASCERGELHYAWYYEDDYEEDLIDLDVTENVLHLVDIEEERAYYCWVSDDYGNNNSIWLYVYFPTELTLSYNDYYDVLPGEGVHLEIIAASPDESTPITYLWYIWDDDEEEWTIIEGETGSGLDITPTGYEEYRCVVTQGEDVRTAYIEVDVSSGLSASAERSTIEAAVGDTVQLKVNAESRLPQINYKWYKNTIEDENLLEEDTDTLEIVLQDVMEIYHCEVTDGYATERITISVIDSSAVEAAPSMESAIEIHTGETKMVRVEDGGAVWLKFVPENDGTYAFFSGSSADTYGYLLDASGSETISSDDDGGENDNFRIETDLYAGTTYYIRARMYDNDAGVFPVTAELISLENGFYAEAKSSTYFKVLPGESVDLEVDAGCTNGTITYEWQKYDNEGYTTLAETGSSLHVANIEDEYTDYRVIVSDEYGNSETIWFEIRCIFTLELDYSSYIDVMLGETATLEVTPVSPDTETVITYQWQYWDDDEGEWMTITGAVGARYVTPKNPYSSYRCIAEQGENTATAQFQINVQTDFSIANDYYELEYPVGSSVMLQPEISGSLPITIEWYKGRVDDENKLDASGNSLTIVTEQPYERYYCVATDGYASGEVMFEIVDRTEAAVTSDTAQSAEDIYNGEVKRVQTYDGGSVYMKFVPVQDGVYQFYSMGSVDTLGYLLDQDLNEITENDDSDLPDNNFKITYELTAGSVYYIRVRRFGDSASEFYVTVEKECDHVSDAGKVTKAATCTAAGEKVYTCTKCGKVLRREVLPATGHKPVALAAVPATCTAAGKTAGSKCSVCGKVITAQKTVPATGHKPVALAAVPATCTAAGKTAGSKCSVCGAVITAQKTVPATGHKPVALAAVPATCTAAGKTAGSKCSVCGTVITAQKTVPALGHKWDAGKVTTEPTASAAGVKTYTCTVCKATKTEPVPKLTPAEAQKKAEGDPNDPKSVAGAEKAMTAVKDNGEPKGSSFSTIQLYSSKQTKNSITLKWNKVKGASGYVIYGNMCGGKYKLQRIAKQKKNSFVYKKLKKGTYYKFTVAAYRSVDGKEEVIGSSKTVHVATLGGKVTNVKSVAATVKKKAVKKLSLKAKKSAVVAAKETLQNEKLTLKRHRKIKYESSDTKIATVNAKGKVTAKKKGKCFIYVYSQSGVFAKITLTVK